MLSLPGQDMIQSIRNTPKITVLPACCLKQHLYTQRIKVEYMQHLFNWKMRDLIQNHTCSEDTCASKDIWLCSNSIIGNFKKTQTWSNSIFSGNASSASRKQSFSWEIIFDLSWCSWYALDHYGCSYAHMIMMMMMIMIMMIMMTTMMIIIFIIIIIEHIYTGWPVQSDTVFPQGPIGRVSPIGDIHI